MVPDRPPEHGLYLGDGEWIAWADFGEFDPDKVMVAHLPRLEWQAEMQRRFPKCELHDLRQFVRLLRCAEEYYEVTGRHLNVFGVLGELFGAVAFGIRLHRKENAQGSDGRLGNDHVEIKTIGPRNTVDRVRVRLSGHFNKLLVVKVTKAFDITGRMVDRKALTTAKAGHAGIAWSRACKIGVPPGS